MMSHVAGATIKGQKQMMAKATLALFVVKCHE